MKYIFTLFAVVLGATLHGQSIERQVVGCSGAQLSNGTVQVFQTLGETFVSAYTGGSVAVYEGFEQAFDKYVNVPQLGEQNSVQVYPNPVRDILIIDATSTVFDYVKIYDLQGKLVFEQKLSGNPVLQLASLGRGVYQVVLISSNNNSIATHQIQKI
ncbi:T9SS type A sorting domain-containing protein [bacterium]|nr:T9SS type A sorting domain-containing protein [bacterium]